MTLCVIIALASIATAQNLHTALWNMGNKCIDFRSGSPVVTDLPIHTFGLYEHDDNWYVDESGELVLRYSTQEKNLYGKNGEPVRGSQTFTSKITNIEVLFIPRPGHPNHIYCISNVYAVVDVEKNEIVGDVMDFAINGGTPPLIVHSEDCSFLWLGLVNATVIQIYQVEENGIVYKKKIELKEWAATPRRAPLCITLSPDCQYYCATEPRFPRDEEPVFFGKFDRETCDFNRISKHIFQQKGEKRQRYLSSIISPSNKYIYLLVMPDASGDIEICNIKRVPIVNGVPDYDNIELVKKISASSESHFRYAIDGNIYIYDDKRRRISRITNPESSDPMFEPDIVVDDSHPYSVFPKRVQNFIATWVTSDYCYDGITATLSCNEVKYYCATSANAKSFSWDFGDGTMASEPSPTHIYGTPGDYNVSVDVVFDDGTSKTYTRTVTILSTPKRPSIITE